MKLILIAILSAILGAALVFAWMHHTPKAPQEKPVAVTYICPMHPQIIRNEPSKCPLCGMDLVPMKDHDHDKDKPADAIKIDPSMIQSIGVRVMEVQESELQKILTIPASIVIDPQRIAVVNTRTMGWIESIPVGSEGVSVQAGQKLASFYSPDLVGAQEDYLQALRSHDANLTASARTRLESLGLSITLIDSIQKMGSAMRSIPLQAPLTGIILAKTIVQGQSVSSGTELYRIADLSHVWAVGQVYPEDLNAIEVGLNAQVTLQASPETPRSGRVLFIAPVVNPETKTTEIRIDLSNTSKILFKPGMNAEIQIPISMGTGVAIPSQSVIRTGERAVAILSLGNGYFAPRDLTLGASLGDSVQVLQGLAAGDSVVSSAQFLIDSESNLKKALQKANP